MHIPMDKHNETKFRPDVLMVRRRPRTSKDLQVQQRKRMVEQQ